MDHLRGTGDKERSLITVSNSNGRSLPYSSMGKAFSQFAESILYCWQNDQSTTASWPSFATIGITISSNIAHHIHVLVRVDTVWPFCTMSTPRHGSIQSQDTKAGVLPPSSEIEFSDCPNLPDHQKVSGDLRTHFAGGVSSTDGPIQVLSIN